jgi:tetratricopeptide (TPR) repeat protein
VSFRDALGEAMQAQPTQVVGDASRGQLAGLLEIEELVDFVHGHAGILATLGVALLRIGVARAHTGIADLLTELERRHPGDDHQSPLASVEHAIARMSPDNQSRVRMLAPFQGGVQAGVLRDMSGWSVAEVTSLISELVDRGLGTLLSESYLAMVPALSPYLRGQLQSEEWYELEIRWQQALREYGAFLMTTGRQDATVTSKRWALDIPNFLALLEYDERVGDAAMTIGTATSLIKTLDVLGKQTLVDRVTRVLETTVQKLKGEWSHAYFRALDARIEQLAAKGQVARACEAAVTLLELARAAGPEAYSDADFDIAMACFSVGRALEEARRAEEALPLIDEARSRFESMTGGSVRGAAAHMAASCIVERADCLTALSHLDEAAELYEEGIRRMTSLHDERSVAVAAARLDPVREKPSSTPEPRMQRSTLTSGQR